MKRLILLAAIALPAPAMADMPVIDLTSIGHMVQELQQLRQSYAQLKETYAMFTNIRGLDGAISAFQMSGLENAMPDTGYVPGMVGGQYGGNLSPYAQQYYNENHVYTPPGADWNAQQMQRREYSTAEIQAVATQNLQQVQKRESVVMPELQNELAGATSITDLNQIHDQIALENGYIASQGVQAQSLQLAAYEQERADRNAQEQMNRQGVDQAINSECSSIAADGAASGLCGGAP